jgi:hypothetical protein
MVFDEKQIDDLMFKYLTAPVGKYLEGPGLPLTLTEKGRIMNEKPSSKATNNEIVKALIILTQDFFNHNPDQEMSPAQIPGTWKICIDESNLVERISIALNSYRRQKDRMDDIMVQMQRIKDG